MRDSFIILIFITIATWIHSTLAATLDQIQTCETQSSYIYAYELCVNCSQNCSLCNGTVDSNNVCQIPTLASCMLPGFMYNAANVCQDCRIEENCLKNCDGYWDPVLKTCIRQANKTFKVQGGAHCLDMASAADCQKCRGQRYTWSTVLSKCLKCPSTSTWDATTMTCSQLSTCSYSNLQGYDSGSCVVCQNPKFLNPYSYSCESCPQGCSCSGTYAKCTTGTCVAPYIETVDNYGAFCECKGATYFDGSNCVACPTNCLKCKSNGQCIQCGNGQLIDKTTFKCVDCAVVSPDPLYCEIKVFAYCTQLTLDGKYCNICQADLIYDSVAKYCVCTGGKMFNTVQNKCVFCTDLFPNCGTCNSTQCLTCKDDSYTLSSDGQQCTCQGFTKNNSCVPCSTNMPNCQTCNSTGTTCLSCMPNYGYITATNQCYACNTIDPSCVSCDTSKLCTACSNGYTLSTAKTSCGCDVSATTRAILNNVCQTCSNAIANCTNCTKNSSGTGLTCTTCSAPYVASNGTCQLCASGYYRTSTGCSVCTAANCSTCSSTVCYGCTNGYSLSGSNTCTCTASGYVIDSADSKCKTCAAKYNSPLCLTCTTTACSTCGGTGYTATATGCQCQKGVVIPNTTTCQACASNCTSCTLNADNSTTTCTQCDTASGYRLMADKTCLQCSAGQYYDSASFSCKNCNSNCAACPDNQNGGSCTSCSNNYILSNGSCVCSGTMVLNSGSCVTCATKYTANCATCNDTQCLTCATDFYLKTSTQTCIQCSTGFYFKADTTNDCTACPNKCQTCTPLTGACTGTCLDNYTLQNGLCQCTSTQVLNQLNECKTCNSLMTNCQTCSSTTVCTGCETGYNLMANSACQTCLSTQYYDSASKSCKNCPANCNTCSNDTAACTGTCQNNYRLDTGACVCTLDRALNSNNVCTMCSSLFENCAECTKTACTKCIAPFALTNDGKCRACTESELYLSATRECKPCKQLIKNCYSCSSTSICTGCVGDPFVLSQTGDACNCPVGNYLIPADPVLGTDEKCIPCSQFDAQCLQCSGLKACTLCNDSYAFDSGVGSCRICLQTEYYDSRPADNVQSCVNCNQVHEQCVQCKNSSECTQCKNNYDAKDATCKCIGNKILIPTQADQTKSECKMCSEVVDPNCDLCSDNKKCDKCFKNYRWDSNYNRCIPDIQLSIQSGTADSKKAMADTFTMSFIIPSQFISAQLSIAIYFFDNIEQYDSEVQLLKSLKIEEVDIPFNYKNCFIYAQDDLKTLPNINYKITGEEEDSSLKRENTFVLHEGNLRFVYTVQSQNKQFTRYAISQDIKVTRAYNSAKDLAFYMGKQVKTLDIFSLYNIFNQILIQENEICSSDDQCNNNGSCIPADKLCKCTNNFKLFDCSDYVTISYDLVIEEITKQLIVTQPVNYQQKFVAMYLPLLVTQSTAFSQAGIASNFHAIHNILKGESIDNNEKDDLENLMKNIMNNVSETVRDINTDFVPQEIISTIKELQSITEQLLSSYDNKVGFTTDDMQLLGKISNDPSLININVDTKDLFDPTIDTSNQLFTNPSSSTGLKAKVLRFAYKENPHKLITPQFLSQPRTYPLIIMNTYMSTKRMLVSTPADTFVSFKKNITFTFQIQSAKSLKNPICLTLPDPNSDQYKICENIQVLESQVICTCENSATVYEDVYYNYLPKPNTDINDEENAPTSMIIAIVILSLLLGFLIFVQIKNRKKQRQLDRISQANAVAAAEAAHKRKLEKDAQDQAANQFLRKGSQEMTITTQQYEQGNLIQSPTLNVKDIRLNLFESSPKQNNQTEDFVIQDNLDLGNRYSSSPQRQDLEDNSKRIYEEEELSSKLVNSNNRYGEEIHTPFSPNLNLIKHKN